MGGEVGGEGDRTKGRGVKGESEKMRERRFSGTSGERKRDGGWRRWGTREGGG